MSVISFDAEEVAVEIVKVLAKHIIPINALDIIFEAVREEATKNFVRYVSTDSLTQ